MPWTVMTHTLLSFLGMEQSPRHVQAHKLASSPSEPASHFPEPRLGMLLRQALLIKCQEGQSVAIHACDTQVCVPKLQQSMAFIWAWRLPVKGTPSGMLTLMLVDSGCELFLFENLLKPFRFQLSNSKTCNSKHVTNSEFTMAQKSISRTCNCFCSLKEFSFFVTVLCWGLN
jgi:hypothetical protein